jgi:mannose-6-phosphate isomerase-like protein (cupin superfamily)
MMPHPARKSVAPLPGGIGITHLRVYDTAAPDGLAGGSAHVHFACTEAYYVISGRGCVQTLSAADGYREIPLEKGSLVWFTPGLIHRLVNEDGHLEIVVPMQNAGLPEAGDFVLCFPFEILADPAAYANAASLASPGHVQASSLAAAYLRRDLAVTGFAQLRERFEREGVGALDAFYALAARLVAPKADSWRTPFERGPKRAVQETEAQLDALASGDFSYLTRTAQVHTLPANAEGDRKFGMCGTLGTYLPEGFAK